MELILECIYTSNLCLTEENVESVLLSAHHLQMHTMVVLCEEFIIDHIRQTNFLSYMKLAEKYGLERAYEKAENCLLHNFSQICEQTDFVDVSKEALCKYLESDKLACLEIDVFRAVKRWIEHDKVRIRYAAELMGKLRFALLSATELTMQVNSVAYVWENVSCRQLVNEAIMYNMNPYTQPLYTGHLNKPRATDAFLLLATGKAVTARWTITNPNTEVHCCRKGPSRILEGFKSTIDVPFIKSSLMAAKSNNFVFFHGIDNRSFSNTMVRFDANTTSWMTLAHVPQDASVGSVGTILAEEIIFAGGMKVNRESRFSCMPDKFLNTAFKYSISLNSWSPISPMTYKVSFAAACHLKELAFVIGGYNDQYENATTTDKVLAYNPTRDVWFRMPSLNNNRAYHCAQSLNGKILVVGGTQSGDNLPQLYNHLEADKSCEVYCATTQQWTVIQGGPCLVNPCVCKMDNQVYVLGGRTSVFSFNEDTQQWMKEDMHLPCNVVHSAAAAVRVQHVHMRPYIMPS